MPSQRSKDTVRATAGWANAVRATATLATALLALSGATVRAESLRLTTPRGTTLSVLADVPPGDGKHPAVVLAPGQGYAMTLPALEATAQALVAQGMAVFRFNWAYLSTTPVGAASADLSLELQDLQTVLAFARAHAQVDPQRLLVGGKSLGSLVAWRAFRDDAKLRGALLLTPICSRVPPGETTPEPQAQARYPAFSDEARPVLLVVGDHDPWCAPAVLYDFARTRAAPARVAVVGGDHSFDHPALPAPAAAAARQRNLVAVGALVAGFAHEVLVDGPATPPPAVPAR